MAQLAAILQGDRTDFELIQLALETLANIMTFEANNDQGKRRASPIIIIIYRSFLEQPNLPQDITIQFTGELLWSSVERPTFSVQNYSSRIKNTFMLRWIWSKYEPKMLDFRSLIVPLVIGNWFQSSTYCNSFSHRSLDQLHQTVARENLGKWADGRLETGRSFARRTRSDSKRCKRVVFFRVGRVQECVLQALLLLQILTQSNANIQKIVAFENGFERLFEILVSEGGCRGGKHRWDSF